MSTSSRPHSTTPVPKFEEPPPPPEGPPRTIVLCFDGTADEYEQRNTNVVKLFSLLKKDDWSKQYCYYQPGIGTYFKPGLVSPLFNWAFKTWDFAVAWYLDQHVISGYKFVMQNYRAGDKICLFGFSRGAYTARALAGMLYKVGVLPRHNSEMVPFAFKMYKRTDEEGCELAMGFKRTFCQDAKIEFIGVWDTVASVGVLSGKTLPFANGNKAVKTFRQALALDEHRARFRASYYYLPIPAYKAATFDSGKLRRRPMFPGIRGAKRSMTAPESRAAAEQAAKSKPIFAGGDETNANFETSVKEVWFAGCHADVGGGSVMGDTSPNLANLSLRWMVKEIMNADCGILFDKEQLDAFSIPTVSVSKVRESEAREKRQQQIYEKDVKAPIHDQIKKQPAWWLLEVVPLHFVWQDRAGAWHRDYSFHKGRGRKILDPEPMFHVSVRDRMVNENYKPKAEWNDGKEQYVD